MPKPTTKTKPANAATKPGKDDVLRFRISKTDKDALVAAAQREGLEVSQWVRQLALRAAGVLPGK